MTRFEMHFGLAVKRVCCLPRPALEFWLITQCDKLNIPAYTVIEAKGYWYGVSEDSLILIVLSDTDSDDKFVALADKYREEFSQEAVLFCWNVTECKTVITTPERLSARKRKKARNTQGD